MNALVVYYVSPMAAILLGVGGQTLLRLAADEPSIVVG